MPVTRAAELFTERLHLRCPVEAHASAIIAIAGDCPHGENRSAELGYYVARPHWGQGIATEAARAVVRLGLDSMGCTTLTSRYHADNPASGRVLEKLGFRFIGRSHHPCLAEGRDKPCIEVEYNSRETI